MPEPSIGGGNGRPPPQGSREGQGGQAGQGTWIEHLQELRSRLLRALIGFLLVFLALLPWAPRLYTLAAKPLQAALPEGASMIAVQVASPLLAPIKLAAALAFLLSAPWVLFQLWRFVAPALYHREKILTVGVFLSSLALFYAGVAFAYGAVFPLLFGFFQLVAPQGVEIMTDISHYVDFVLGLVLVFGLAFETPVVVVLLSLTGVVARASLARARPWVVLGAVTAGMLLTPPDLVSQILLAVPLWLLYELGLLAAAVLERRPADAKS